MVIIKTLLDFPSLFTANEDFVIMTSKLSKYHTLKRFERHALRYPDIYKKKLCISSSTQSSNLKLKILDFSCMEFLKIFWLRKVRYKSDRKVIAYPRISYFFVRSCIDKDVVNKSNKISRYVRQSKRTKAGVLTENATQKMWK